MNIIKFKDQIKLGDDMFNTFLKGRYAYWIHMRYAVPLEFITQKDYIAMESDINNLIDGSSNKGKDKHYWDLWKEDKLQGYVDETATEEINNVLPLIRDNKFTTDSDITLDEIKKFRTWLASTLLTFDQDAKGNQKNEFYTEEFAHVLEYYKNHMYDDTVKWLIKYGKPNQTTPYQTPSKCGCSSNNQVSDFSDITYDTCDPIYIYKNNIYNDMVLKFGNIDFWINFSELFLAEFKAYIDNIIRLNLPLKTPQYQSDFSGCNTLNESEQQLLLDVLKRLSYSLELILSKDVSIHRNQISKSFQDWAKMLYENMEWA